MPWICPCTASNEDFVRFCCKCGNPCELAQVPKPASARVRPAKTVPAPAFSSIAGWKLAAIGGVLLLGTVFGGLVAVTVFGGQDPRQTAETHLNGNAKGGVQEAFETSFKSSCRQSAMRSGHVSQAVADTYCDCALSVFQQTHSMTKAAQTCSQRIAR